MLGMHDIALCHLFCQMSGMPDMIVKIIFKIYWGRLYFYEIYFFLISNIFIRGYKSCNVTIFN